MIKVCDDGSLTFFYCQSDMRVSLSNKMGGCKESRDTCNSTSCRGYEVDIMHFSVGNSIPGRLYGGELINADGQGNK